MKKTLLSSLFLVTILSADTFEVFLEHALQNSDALKASKLDIIIMQEQSDTLLRYNNPSLGVDYARFNPDNAKDDDGYSVQLSQPIRLWGVGEDTQALATLMQEGAALAYLDDKSLFIKDLSLHFVAYAKMQKLLALGLEEQTLSDKIYAIAKKRFKAGNIAKKELLQTQVLMQKQAIETEALRLKSKEAYLSLLSVSGESEMSDISSGYHFKLGKAKAKNPSILSLENAQKKAKSQGYIAGHKVTEVTLAARYEKEYEQDISSLGLSFPLAVFNTKSQESRIATLKAKQLVYKKAQSEKKMALLLKKLSFQREKLYAFKIQNENVLQTEQTLLSMFEEGYRISKSNLLELQHAKNALIKTKQRLILLDATLDSNIITSNYLQGVYHD